MCLPIREESSSPAQERITELSLYESEQASLPHKLLQLSTTVLALLRLLYSIPSQELTSRRVAHRPSLRVRRRDHAASRPTAQAQDYPHLDLNRWTCLPKQLFPC